jgi:DNA primase
MAEIGLQCYWPVRRMMDHPRLSALTLHCSVHITNSKRNPHFLTDEIKINARKNKIIIDMVFEGVALGTLRR